MFRCLQGRGVPYCVLRNHEGLPYRNVATDLDLLVLPAHLDGALGCITGAAGTTLTGHVRRAVARHLFVAGVCWDGNRAIEVDVMTAAAWKGIPYLSTDDVLGRARPAAPDRPLIVVPDPVDEAIISLMSSFLVGGWIKDRYQDTVRRAFTAEPDEAARRLAPAFGPEPAARLIARIAAGDDAGALKMVPRLRRRLLWGALRGAPLRTAGRLAAHYRREAEIRWTPRYVADVYVTGGDPAERAAAAADVATAVAHMAKDVRILTAGRGLRGRLAGAVRRVVPGVRNRALRIWTGPPGKRPPRRSLVLSLGGDAADGVVTLPAEPSARLEAAVAEVRSLLAGESR